MTIPMAASYDKSGVALYQGDCRVIMGLMASNSIDAIVTDPPYHLIAGKKGGSGAASLKEQSPAGRSRVTTGFMGQAWDGGDVAFQPETWAAALRIAKPGAYLVAFGGTRTYHRLTCAIEDAGWEIRDCLMYIFGSGFPKSYNVDRVRGDKTCGCTPTSERDVRPVSNGDVSKAQHIEEEQGEVLQHGLSQQSLSAEGWEELPSTEVRRAESSLEGRRDDLQETRELFRSEVCASTGLGEADGEEGRLCDGTSPSDGRMVRAAIDQDRSGAPQGSCAGQESARESGDVAGQSEPQISGAWPLCDRCSKPMVPQGLGTSLKPAYEPIILARKKLDGTVAENILKWGTGAMNIDGCRVDGASWNRSTTNKQDFRGGRLHAGIDEERHKRIDSAPQNSHALGRWPANIIHDGSDDVVSTFPNAPGQLIDQKVDPGARKNQSVYGAMKRNRDEPSADSDNEGEVGFKMKPGARRMDEGSAARFFYSAKASGTDRGHEEWDALPLFDEPAGAFRNTHPTVKPLALMRYLLTLVSRDGSLVIDPFVGSGSTLVAAKQLGRAALGMDLDQGHLEIAIRRLDRL